MSSPEEDATLLSPENQQKLDSAQMIIQGAIATGDMTWLSELPSIDTKEILNSIHMPKDAGDYATDIERILRRIPDGWGRWISCDAGWYPLVIKLDKQLATIMPEYKVHQVKEKYGTLRYYCDATDEMEELIAATEIESSKTCEICGALGEICVKNYWYKTLCNTCATTNGYAPDPELDTP